MLTCSLGIGKVVGEETIASSDLLTKVHHICHGLDCWKVWVIAALIEDIPLTVLHSSFMFLVMQLEAQLLGKKKQKYILLE